MPVQYHDSVTEETVRRIAEHLGPEFEGDDWIIDRRYCTSRTQVVQPADED